MWKVSLVSLTWNKRLFIMFLCIGSLTVVSTDANDHVIRTNVVLVPRYVANLANYVFLPTILALNLATLPPLAMKTSLATP
jgi:hypothetical protein